MEINPFFIGIGMFAGTYISTRLINVPKNKCNLYKYKNFDQMNSNKENCHINSNLLNDEINQIHSASNNKLNFNKNSIFDDGNNYSQTKTNTDGYYNNFGFNGEINYLINKGNSFVSPYALIIKNEPVNQY